MMQTVKQPEGSTLCVVACAAMILEESFWKCAERFRLVFAADLGAWYAPRTEMARVLAKFGWLLGTSAVFDPPERLDDDEEIHFKPFAINGAHAILSVAGDAYLSGVHAVVWDSDIARIRDPAPDTPETGLLDDYAVKEWELVRRCEG